MTSWSSSALLLAALAIARTGWAQTATDMAARQVLIDQAREARERGDHQAALGLAERAAKIRMTPSLRLFVAREQGDLGQVADAYANAQRCGFEAEHDTGALAREQTMQLCRELEKALAPRVGRLVLDVPAPPPGLRVTIEGRELNEAALGIPYVVKPGTIAIEARAPGHLPFRSTLDVVSGQTVRVAMTLVPEATPPKPLPIVETPARDPEPRRARPNAGLLIAGGGLVLAAAGTLAWLRADAEYRNRENTCQQGCSPQQVEASIDRIRPLDRLATAGWIVGGLMAAGGLIHYSLLGGPSPSGDRASVSVSVAPASATATLRVDFP